MKRAAPAVWALGVTLACAPAQARGLRPLERLPDEKLIALAPLLRRGDLALIESKPDGTMKQVSLFLWVAAAPETVREVIAHPGDYSRFVPHVTRSTWEPRERGGLSSWKIELPVSSFEEHNEYQLEPGALGAVVVTSPDEDDGVTLRWEFLPAPGGCVLVQYGFSDVRHSNAMVRSFIRRMPVTEHGLALAAQLMLAANMRIEAERRQARGGAALPAPRARAAEHGPGFGFLLERGQVVVLRSTPDGRLGDVSLLDRVFAPAAKIQELLTHPAEWPRFIPGVEASRERSRSAGTVEYSSDFSVPVVTWSASWAMRFGARTVEGVATAGDLEGGHFQWDLEPRGAGETLVIYRVNLSLGHGSLLARKLFEYQPSLEHGLTTAFSLVYLRAIRGRAEGWGVSR